EARNDAAAREAALAGLEKALRQGDKALVGNKGFRRFLKTEADSHFAIDPERVAAAAKFDGIYVIRTNAQISPLVVALRYRQRWIVEDIFRTAKSIINTRPIFHQRDDTIRGHVFCSFLALLLRKELIDRLAADGPPMGVGTNGPISFATSTSSFKPTSIRVAEGFACAPPLPVALAPC